MKKYIKIDKLFYGYKIKDLYHGIQYSYGIPWLIEYKEKDIYKLTLNNTRLYL